MKRFQELIIAKKMTLKNQKRVLKMYFLVQGEVKEKTQVENR